MAFILFYLSVFLLVRFVFKDDSLVIVFPFMVSREVYLLLFLVSFVSAKLELNISGLFQFLWLKVVVSLRVAFLVALGDFVLLLFPLMERLFIAFSLC